MEHKHLWFINREESVFGQTRVHAILECGSCHKRKPPQVMDLKDFRTTGKEPTYWLKEGVHA